MMPKTIIISLLSLAILLDCSCAFSPQYLGRYRNEHLCLSSKVDPNENREGSLAAATKTLGKVPYGEQSRKYRRTVFKHDDWVNHRSSSSRVLDNLQSLFFSGVVRQLRPQVTAVSAVAVFVLMWNIGLVSNIEANQDIAFNLPIIAWALLVPCALYSSFSEAHEVLATLPASMILAFFLFGIDELAMQLEEPFSILPMGYFCKDILDSSTILVEMDDLEVQEEVIS